LRSSCTADRCTRDRSLVGSYLYPPKSVVSNCEFRKAKPAIRECNCFAGNRSAPLRALTFLAQSRHTGGPESATNACRGIQPWTKSVAEAQSPDGFTRQPCELSPWRVTDPTRKLWRSRSPLLGSLPMPIEETLPESPHPEVETDGRGGATMILLGETEAGSAGTQPCRGIT
jgi:hypothetical protein